MNNESFLNKTGLTYYHDRAKTLFENKIEKVKVNGTEQTITNKEINIKTPEFSVNAPNNEVQEATITNKPNGQVAEVFSLSKSTDDCVNLHIETANMSDTPLDVNLASKDYVDTNAGKIDKIKVNNVEQTIPNKEVNIEAVQFNGTKLYGKYTDATLSGGVTVSMDFEPTLNGMKYKTEYDDGEIHTTEKELVTKDYVDSKGSVAIDSTNNNKTTFTNGNKTSSIMTSPDGVIYTEGAVATEVPSKAYVDSAVAGVTGMEFVLVDTLPAEGEKGKIYLLSNNTAGSNVYDEYIWVQAGANGRFEKIGSTDVDLSNYYNTTNLVAITTAEIDALFA